MPRYVETSDLTVPAWPLTGPLVVLIVWQVLSFEHSEILSARNKTNEISFIVLMSA